MNRNKDSDSYIKYISVIDLIIKNSDEKLVNQFVKVKVIDVSNYDLIGEIVKEN